MKNTYLCQKALKALKIAYAILDSSWRILEHDTMFSLWMSREEDDLRGTNVMDVLPEFFGQEAELRSVQQHKKAQLQIEHVNRSTPDGEPCYLTLTAIPAQKDAAALTILVSDVSEQGHYLQELTQNRNELRLLRRKLCEVNEQLDFLLRHYLPPDVAEALVKGTLRPELGGELRQASILFADARDFTPLAERLSPGHVMHILNDYLGVVVEAIDEYGGTVNQFQGDSVMAIFNAHGDQPEHAMRAVKAGIGLQQAISAYQGQRPKDDPQMHFGVGINTGPVIVGNAGAHWRYTYTAIGDTTNLAARITSIAPAYEVLISEATYAYVHDKIYTLPLPPVIFKGKSQPTPIFRILRDTQHQGSQGE